MRKSNVGVYNELKAILWFIEQGWEVFNNMKPSGPADLVVWNPETDETIKVDVKTITTRTRTDGTKSHNFSGVGNTEATKPKPFVRYLGYCKLEDKFIWLDQSGDVL